MFCLTVRGTKNLLTSGLYDNVDLIFTSNQNGIKQYFVVKPGGDPTDIIMELSGADTVVINSSTNALTVYTSIGNLCFEKPSVYQIDGANNIIDTLSWTADWQIYGTSNVLRFNIGNYNANYPLIIQVDQGHNMALLPPMNENLEWSTYYGGNIDEVFYDVDVDDLGRSYVCGVSSSIDFPTTINALYGTNLGGYKAVVMKFDNSDNRLWATYYGGNTPECSSNYNEAYALDIDEESNIYFTGSTDCSDFPYYNAGNGAYLDSVNSSTYGFCKNGYVAKIDSTGRFKLWATYYGGTGVSRFNDITVNPDDDVYVVGNSDTTADLVQKQGAYNSSTGTNLILKFNNSDSLIWATLFGNGVINGVAVDEFSNKSDYKNFPVNMYITGTAFDNQLPIKNPGGNAYVDSIPTYSDAFIAKFNDKDSLIWSTYYGGNSLDDGIKITAKNSNVFVSGQTASASFPCYSPGANAYIDSTLGAYGSDAFVLKFNSGGERLWATLYGGAQQEFGYDVEIDAAGFCYVTGYTESFNSFPTEQLANAYFDGGWNGDDAFLLAFNPQLERIWATLFGGTNGDERGLRIAIYDDVKLYIVGQSNSSLNFPLYNPGGGAYYDSTLSVSDGFITRFGFSPVIATFVYENFPFDNQVLVYPNPSSGLITIQFTHEDAIEGYIKVYNIQGNLVFSKMIKEQQGCVTKQYDLSQLSKGLYILEVTTGKNKSCSKLLIY